MIIATTTKDYKILTKLFHILMPSGFVLMIASVFFTLESFKNLLINMFDILSLMSMESIYLLERESLTILYGLKIGD